MTLGRIDYKMEICGAPLSHNQYNFLECVEEEKEE